MLPDVPCVRKVVASMSIPAIGTPRKQVQTPESNQAFHGEGTFFAILAGIYGFSFMVPVRWIDAHPSPCLFRSVTGLPCPGCGLSRSFVHTSHRDVAGAIKYHFFGPLLFVVGLLLLAMRGIDLLFGKQLVLRLELGLKRSKKWWAAAALWWVYALGRFYHVFRMKRAGQHTVWS